ncbi:MAG: UPF0176 protein [Pseudomonadales bacterium]|jgi:UPF0176 protein
MHAALSKTGVLGTILIAEEGINVALAGSETQVSAAREYLNNDKRFSGLWLKESLSDIVPFSKLKVRIRHEIIAFDGSDAHVQQLTRPTAPAITPENVQHWIESGKVFTLLDTRNMYEIESGTFEQAEHLNIAHFRDFQSAVHKALEAGTLNPDKPLVTFCTGGIRCEKAAPWLIEQGFSEVHQIDGGVLNYFERTGGAHWEGDCFVFDDRVEVDKKLSPTGATWCTHCQLTIRPGAECTCQSSLTAIDIV